MVNALSDWLEVTVCKEGHIHKQRYERGKVCYPLKVLGDTDKTGTTVTFYPDATIFETIDFDYNTLKRRLRETAFLTKNLKIVLTDDRGEEQVSETFHYEGGIKEFVTYLNKGKEALYPDVIYCEGEKDGVYVEVAFQHNDSYNETSLSFVNNIITPEGGTHLSGFKMALTSTFNDYARKNNLLKEKEDNLSGEDIREGLTSVISIKIGEPQFEGQTKQKLGNSEARAAVEGVMSEQLTYYLEQNPAIAKIICEKDPYHHLRSIHNCLVFYDYNRPWITHCSIQRQDLYKSSELVNEWREKYQKPVVLDEIAYEGNIQYGWGNISGEELTRRFWEAACRGGYPGHGETYMNDKDILWWSHGGTLHGESYKRFKLLHDIMCETPGIGLRPYENSGWDEVCAVPEETTQKMKKVKDYYLIYFSFMRPSFREYYFDDETQFRVKVIDTWNMTVEDRGVFKGKFKVELPGKPYMAIQIKKIQ